jgi:hypothetical protein
MGGFLTGVFVGGDGRCADRAGRGGGERRG